MHVISEDTQTNADNVK